MTSDRRESKQAESYDWSPYKKVWDEDIQFHGFFSQGLFHTSGNNVYGKSKDSVSAGLTEMGVNMSYQALSNLSFAAQGLYRRAGASTGDWGELSLDFAFVDMTLLNFSNMRLGVRAGRVKNPWGLYNETRDVAFTHPTIFLPLNYFERSRSLLLAMDGGQLYTDYYSSIGHFSFKFNYGYVNDDNDEFLLAITTANEAQGHLQSDPSLMTQLNYDLMQGRYIFAVSFGALHLNYVANGANDFYSGLKVHTYPLLFSAQFNGEKFSLTGEYSIQWNEFSGASGQPDLFPISEHWYLQVGYRILDNLEFNIRYDSSVPNIDDRDGQLYHQLTGLPAHIGYTYDWVIGLRWDISSTWMVRTEYHWVNGASMLSSLDNPDPEDLVQHWNIFAFQVAYRF